MITDPTTAAMSQGGFLTTLAGHLNSAEAFIIIVILIICLVLWKVWGEFKQLFKDREHTAKERNAEIAKLHEENGERKSEIVDLRGQITSHFQIHLELDKKFDSLEEMKKEIYGIKGGMEILLERSGGKPRLTK